jgi:putative tryptophan/tyrosine transport system substrate-binding protein
MRRREFIAGFCSVCWAAAAGAEQPGPVRKIGLIMPSRAEDAQGQRQFKHFNFGLERLGWINGRNISLFVRWSGGEPSLAKQFANELVRLEPELIVAGSTIGLEAARSATSKIPIVFVAVSDPVAAGYVKSLASPGGNITGFSSFDIETGGKWLEILKEVVPTASRVGILMDPDYAGYITRWRAMAELGPSFGVELSQVAIQARGDIEEAISAFAKEPKGALIVFSSALTSANSGLIVNLADRYRLPTIYPFAFYVKKGGLISYGIDTVDLFERSASYVDRILRGTKPADLPIQRPTKFEMAINLKTAKALGIAVPQTLLIEADEVIE